MGRVFLGRSAGGRLLAIKVIRAELAEDPNFRTRFSREVDAARKVSGIFTAPVVDADADGLMPWLATAYVPGPSLAEAVASQGPFPVGDLLALAAGLAEGLIAVHAAGLVHRDLKPANVLLADDGPRVIDFGVSRAAEASALTGTGLVVGSPGFMSPEQAEGREVGPPSDVFSLGGVLTFAGTGEGPFGTGPTPALLYRIVHSPPTVDGLPEPVRELAERCLHKDPRQRPSPAQILSELEDAEPLGGWLRQPVIEQAHPQPPPEHRASAASGTVTPPEPAPTYPPTVTTAGASAPGQRPPQDQGAPQPPALGPHPVTTGQGASPTSPRRRSRPAMIALVALPVVVIGCVLALVLSVAFKPKPANPAQSAPASSTPVSSTVASAGGQAASQASVNPCQGNPANSAVVGAACFTVPSRYVLELHEPDYMLATGSPNLCSLGNVCTDFVVLTGQAYDAAFKGQQIGNQSQALGFSFSKPLDLSSYQSFAMVSVNGQYPCTGSKLVKSGTQPFGSAAADYREWTYDCPKDEDGASRELQVWNVPAAQTIVISYQTAQSGSTPIQAMVAQASFIKETAAELPVPVLTAPKSGAVFGIYPRNTTLSWKPVANATAYLVQVQACSVYGCTAAPSGENTDIIPMIRLTDETSYSFQFVGAQPGRWRVLALRSDGELSEYSPWWGFRYTQ